MVKICLRVDYFYFLNNQNKHAFLNQSRTKNDSWVFSLVAIFEFAIGYVITLVLFASMGYIR